MLKKTISSLRPWEKRLWSVRSSWRPGRVQVPVRAPELRQAPALLQARERAAALSARERVSRRRRSSRPQAGRQSEANDSWQVL
jgi:hypothetical protein